MNKGGKGYGGKGSGMIKGKGEGKGKKGGKGAHEFSYGNELELWVNANNGQEEIGMD